MEEMGIIIFSKDRAAQLHLLLRSISHNVGIKCPIVVLVGASNASFEEGYQLLRDMYPEVEFVDQTDFKNVFESTIARFKHILLHCDDDVYIRPFSQAHIDKYKERLESGELINVSLRLNPFMDYCYPLKRPMSPIKVEVWPWSVADADFGYSVSISNTWWYVPTLLKLVKNLSYDKPNPLESAMHVNVMTTRGTRPEKMACFKDNVAVNVPDNLVQSSHSNRFEGGDAERLNERFLAGDMIDYAPFNELACNAPFYSVKYKWI